MRAKADVAAADTGVWSAAVAETIHAKQIPITERSIRIRDMTASSCLTDEPVAATRLSPCHPCSGFTILNRAEGIVTSPHADCKQETALDALVEDGAGRAVKAWKRDPDETPPDIHRTMSPAPCGRQDLAIRC